MRAAARSAGEVDEDQRRRHERGIDAVVACRLRELGAELGSVLVRRIVQDHLAPAGAVIIGVPNCRYVDGEVEYGARLKNFRQPELGLVIKDIAFYRKYLQQHDRQVFVTGKHYLFITAVASHR